MKKMLVLFLILFTTVLADSDEDKYIDLLSDEEKQEFLEKVARRILKDVQSQEEITDAQSGEVNDDQLKQHTEYVKAVLKEEQENIRRSKGYENETEEKPLSEEKDLGVKPLASLKVSLFNDRQDLTLRTEQGDAESDKDSTNNITAEIVMDDAPIIKRSVKDDNTNSSSGSDETTSETLNRVSETNITSEEINDVQTANEKSNNSTSNVQALSETDSEAIESKSEEDKENRVKPVEGNSSNLSEKVALNVSVKGIHEGSRRLIDNIEGSMPTVNTTVNNTATAAEVIKSNENNSTEYNNVSNADEELTTSSNLFKGTSAKGNTEGTFTIGSFVESTIETITNKTTENTEYETETISVPETTASIVDTTMNLPEITNDSKILMTEAETESTTFMASQETTESTMSLVATTEKKIDVEDYISTPTKLSIVKRDNLEPKKSIKLKKNTTNPTKFPQTVTTATPETKEYIEVATRKTIDHKILVHRPSKHIVGPKAKKNAETDSNSGLNKNFLDLGKVYFNNNKKVKNGKEYHVFEIPADSSPLFDEKEDIVEQPYYVPIYNYSPNNAYFNPKNRLGPNPGDSDIENIFNDDNDLNEFDRTESLNVKMEYDSTYDSKRKKFGSKQKVSQSINRQPLQNKQPLEAESQFNAEDYLDSDYYYGRVRKVLLRKANEDLNTFPNSDETDHPAHSIQEGSLKDHVRAVRNILFQQKSFGLLEKDKYGESMEQVLKTGSKRNVKEALRKGLENDFKATNDIKNGKNDENHISIDYYFGRENPILTDLNQDRPTNTHIQKVGYLKNQNDTKALYIMDDVFKANVEKYIQENGITPATPRPDQTAKAMVLGKRDALIAYLRMEERQNKRETVSLKTNKRAVETKNAAPNQNDIPIYPNGGPSEKVSGLKLSVRRNDVVKVSVYLQVLKDMITLDNKALVQYDWLGTTVDIQASLQKLFELTFLVAAEEEIHPADMEILKYVLFLHNLSSEIIEANDFGAQIRNKLDVTRNKRKKKKSQEQKEKGLLNKVWLYLRKEVPEVNEYGALKSLNSFLINLEDGLYDLHVAIKNIAKITKYKNQHWYQNLKDLYVETDEKHLLEVLLHITALRLFSLIEESAKNGLEDDYVEYMKQNRRHCKRTLEEMIFVMEVLKEYNKYVEL